MNVLLKKGTETGAFLAAPALEALRAMCENCAESRLVASLLSLTGGAFKASPQVKLRVVTCINTMIRRMGSRIASGKEGEKMLLMLASLLSEGAIEVRSAVREALAVASDAVPDAIDFDRLLQRSMNSALYSKVKETLAKDASRSGDSSFASGKKASPGPLHPQSQSASQSQSQCISAHEITPMVARILSSKRLKAGGKGVLRGGPLLREKETLKHIAQRPMPAGPFDLRLETSGIGMQGPKAEPSKHTMVIKSGIKRFDKHQITYLTAAEEPAEFENIAIVAANMSSSDWKARVDAIEALMDLAEKNAEFLQRSTKFVIVLEALVKGLSDSNSKVSLKAVSALERFVPLFKTGIEQNVQMLLNGLNNDICSTNVTLKNRADTLIDLLIDTVESSCLAQPFVHLSLYGNVRARPTIVLHLCGTLSLQYFLRRNPAGDPPHQAGPNHQIRVPGGDETAGRQQDRHAWGRQQAGTSAAPAHRFILRSGCSRRKNGACPRRAQGCRHDITALHSWTRRPMQSELNEQVVKYNILVSAFICVRFVHNNATRVFPEDESLHIGYSIFKPASAGLSRTVMSLPKDWLYFSVKSSTFLL